MSGTPQQTLNTNIGALASEIESLGSDFAGVVLDDKDAQAQAAAAAASATAAASSASTASTAATNASNSATAAAGSATTAGSSATAAANSATTAANSAAAAASSATAASGSATTASNAATSAQAALSAMESGFIAPVIAKGSQGITLSASQVYSVTASFTAPVAGWVVAFGHVNLASVDGVSISVNLSINGNNVSGDSTLLSQAHQGMLAVGAGAGVTITLTLTNQSSTTATTNMTPYVGGFFVPSTL